MNCEICSSNPSKYRCPKCGIKYCSLVCYKSETHKHLESQTEEIKEKTATNDTEIKEEETKLNATIDTQDPELSALYQDPKFLKYLNEPTIQMNLHILFEIIQNVSLTNEYNTDGRMEIANKKLINLRSGGLEENVIFEEFCEYILNKLYREN